VKKSPAIQTSLPLGKTPKQKRGRGRPRKYKGYATRYGDRMKFSRRTPLHITLKVDQAFKSLRRRDEYRAVRAAMVKMLGRDDFRIIHLSLEGDHLHLVVEATSHQALAAGMKSFESSAAQRLNRCIGRRGRVFMTNYFARVITSPTQALHVMRYVLCNWRKHKQDRRYECANWQVDYFSTAPSFTGWTRPPDPDCSHDLGWEYEPMPASEPAHFFLYEGWRRVGTIRFDTVPSA
jgi:REP element-mobilizing transposase RayT